MHLLLSFLFFLQLSAAQNIAFRPAASMLSQVAERESVRLADGRVLTTGGSLCSTSASGTFTCTSSPDTEIYDPVSNSWTTAAPLATPRRWHSLIRLLDGRVIAIGGRIPTGWTSATEIFDPATNRWTAGPRMSVARYLHRAVLLPGGRVLVTGGGVLTTGVARPTASSELLDPQASRWSPAAPMSAPRYDHSLTLLPDGRVLASFGFQQDEPEPRRANPNLDIYDPSSDSWSTVATLKIPRIVGSASLLPDGRVLLAGGINDDDAVERSTEILHPDGRLTTGPNLNTPRSYQSSTILPNGQLLLAAGYDSYLDPLPPLASTEVFDAQRDLWVPGPSLLVRRSFHNAILLLNGTLLMIGGRDESDRAGTSTEILATLPPTSGQMVAVPAASYSDNASLAPDSLAAAFGSNLATTTTAATTLPLGTTLGGLSLSLRDSAGITRPASLLLVSPGQINFLVPREAAPGPATLTLQQNSVSLATASVQIAPLAPALFAANGSGQGLPAASVVRSSANGTLVQEPVARFDAATNRFLPLAITPSTPTQPAVLVLAASGIRNRSSLAAVKVTIGTLSLPIQYAGPSPEFPGLDQINVALPASLAGLGLVELALSVDGREANPLQIQIR
jgi:uncharacterized protein (TIGR03437 family)